MKRSVQQARLRDLEEKIEQLKGGSIKSEQAQANDAEEDKQDMKEQFLAQFINKDKVAALQKKRRLKQQRKQGEESMHELVTSSCSGRNKLHIVADT